MRLTKKYRVVYYSDSKGLLLDYTIEYNSNCITKFTDANLLGFESDSFEDIENYVQDNELIQIENDPIL